MYHTILFDLDGTLTDSKDGILNSIRYALEKLGAAIPPERTLLKFVGPPLENSFAEHCGFGPEQIREAVRLFRERYETEGRYEATAAPGMVALCAELKARGCVLALASSKAEYQCPPIVEHFGYAPYLDIVIGSPVGADWDKARVIQEALARLGVADKSTVVMVGDRKYDVEGAIANGIPCVGTDYFGYAEPGELEQAGAVAVVRDAAELRAYLFTHG